MRHFTLVLLAVVDLIVLSPAGHAQLKSPIAHPKFTRNLPVPSRIDATQPGTQLNASMQETWQDLGLVDVNGNTLMTRVWGYNFGSGASYPSQTVEAKSNVPLQIYWTNELTNGYFLPVDTTVHWAFSHQHGIWNPATQTPVPAVAHLHGGHTESVSDGLPDAWFTPGFEYRGEKFLKTSDGTTAGTPLPHYYDNDQQAATLWFHDHALGVTRLNVYAGLAGFYLLRDAYEEQLIADNKIPSGAYEIEMAIQDRMFDANGQLYIPSDPMDDDQPGPTIMPEFFGDYILVNGMTWPKLNVEPRPYRFRILNGSDSRFYRLYLGGNVTITQIGGDGGFLEAPVALTQLVIAPGERADVVIDFTNYAGQTMIMKNNGRIPYPNGSVVNPNTTGQIMAFVVDQPLNTQFSKPQLSATFQPLPALPTVSRTRRLLLFEGKDQYGRLLPSLGTVEDGMMSFADPVTETPLYGSTEMWEVYNTTPDAHPIHLHLVQFRVINRQRFTAVQNPETGLLSNIRLIGKAKPAPATEQGWKDTAPMLPGEVTRVVATFDRAGEYVWHCHILSHEDHEMMRPFVVAEAMRTGENNPAQPLSSHVVLEQNYPNPANASTQIVFEVNNDAHTSLTVYDLQGKAVVTLIDQFLPSGKHTVNLNTAELPAGLYVYTLRTGNEQITKRMEVIR